jgi:xanthine dehydrogenase small subunit
VPGLGPCLLNHQLVPLTAADGGVALGWLRRVRGLTGTKEGCGEGECGACTVLLGEAIPGGAMTYRAVAACLLPTAELAGRHLVTVEGLNPPDGLTPVQQALVDAGAPQCGFCFPGIVLALTGFLLTSDDLTAAAAAVALDGNICRCTGYAAIGRAVQELCAEAGQRLGGPDGALAPGPDRTAALIAWGVLPRSFADAADRLRAARPDAGPGPAALPGPSESEAAAGAARPGRLIAGGTDLLVQEPDLADHGGLIHLSRRADLATITTRSDHLRIGGGVTVEQLRTSAAFAALVPGAPAMMTRFASTVIRGRATVAGNLVNASPIGDLTVLLLALGAELELVHDGQRRTLPLADLFRGYKDVDLAAGEVLEAVRVPLAVAHGAVSFEKVSQRHILDIASVNSALWVRLEQGRAAEARLAVGGVAPVPLLARRASAALVGGRLDAAAVARAAAALDAEIQPIHDVRGSAAYKRTLAGRLLQAHVQALAPGAPGPDAGPATGPTTGPAAGPDPEVTP